MTDDGMVDLRRRPEDLVETPSGKGTETENFPVGSFLLPRRLRPHVAKFYRFARAIDDIADNPDLAAVDKLARLEGFDRAVCGKIDDPAYGTAIAMRESLAETGVPADHCRDLISAFKQDAVKNRYENWDELIDYCLRSAAPVGRYLLDLHGESRNAWPYTDALCNALQVINHLQDCADDCRELDRVYLPADWMRVEGASIDDLAAAATPAGMRRVMDRCLDATEELVATARKLPSELNSLNLAAESSVIVVIAERLTDLLRRRDPIATRVELSRPRYLWCGAVGIARVIATRRRSE